MKHALAGPSTIRHAVVFTTYVVIAIVFTWPLAAHLETAMADPGDPLHLSWILDWDIHALTRAPLGIFDAPMFYGSKYPLAYSENLIGIALLCIPFHFLGFGPVAIYNVALLLGLAFSAWSGYVLGWTLTKKNVPSFVTGLLFGFVTYKWGHVQHLQVVWSGCTALLLAALLHYRRSPTAKNAAFVAASLVANALMNIYLLLFGATTLVLSLVLIAVAERHDARFWLRLLAALAIGGLLILPILAPYWIVSREYGMTRIDDEVMGASATPADWLIAGGRSRLYGPMTDPARRRGERELFPGVLLFLLPLTALLLSAPRRDALPAASPPDRPRLLLFLDVAIILVIFAIWAASIADRVRLTWGGVILFSFRATPAWLVVLVLLLVARLAIRLPRAFGEGNLRSALARSRFPLELWIAALWIVVGFVGSMGLHTFFHSFLFHSVPGFGATRVAARWAMISYAGLAAWAAVGMTVMATRRWRAPLFVALALLDVWPRIRWEHAVLEPSEVDLWIARERAGPFFLLPMDTDPMYLTLLRATAHHQPMFNGVSSFEPPLHQNLRPLSDKMLATLEQHGCRFVIVRPDWVGWQAPMVYAWLRAALARGQLVFVRRFEFSAGGDWVFALPHVERDWRRLRPPDVRNPAGFTPDEELARLLAGQQPYSGTTFGRLANPTPYSEVRGPMEIAGLAMSPFGIRSVTAVINNGQHRVPMQLFERADYTQRFPWYPATPRPAFGGVIPRRPKGVWRYTDVQIEIVDGRGRVTLLPDVPVTWDLGINSPPGPAGNASARRATPARSARAPARRRAAERPSLPATSG